MAFSILKLPASTVQALSASLGSVVAPVTPLPNLEQLALTAPNPMGLDDLALAVGVREELFRRVTRNQQPLPEQLLPAMAAALGLQPGEVAAAARQVTRAGDKLLPGLELGARVLTPLPPDRLLGDPIYLVPIVPTAPVFFGS